MSDSVGETGLKFFGVMTASISHELKNRLAIINEHAGLLSDLLRMVPEGGQVDLSRLDRIAHSVSEQVSLANDIIRNLNRFAHIIDELWYEVDLGDLLGRCRALFSRLAAMQCVTLEVAVPADPVRVGTSPFLLLNLLWLCVYELARASTQPRTVTLRLARVGDGVRLEVESLGGGGEAAPPRVSEEMSKLAETLRADVSCPAGAHRFSLDLPAGPAAGYGNDTEEERVI